MTTPDWERCKPLIEAALEHAGGTHTIEDIHYGIIGGRFGFYPLADSALVAEIIVYPKLRDLHIFLAGGELEELKAFVDHRLPDIARGLGCSRITIAGRIGFSRALRDIGYIEKWTVLSKEIG